jgi:hypothetical protein
MTVRIASKKIYIQYTLYNIDVTVEYMFEKIMTMIDHYGVENFAFVKYKEEENLFIYMVLFSVKKRIDTKNKAFFNINFIDINSREITEVSGVFKSIKSENEILRSMFKLIKSKENFEIDFKISGGYKNLIGLEAFSLKSKTKITKNQEYHFYQDEGKIKEEEFFLSSKFEDLGELHSQNNADLKATTMAKEKLRENGTDLLLNVGRIDNDQYEELFNIQKKIFCKMA